MSGFAVTGSLFSHCWAYMYWNKANHTDVLMFEIASKCGNNVKYREFRGFDCYLPALVLSRRIRQFDLFGFCLSCAESRVTKNRRAACLWSQCGLFNLWPSCTGKMKGCSFPCLMVIVTSLRCPWARFFYPELPPHLLTVDTKSGKNAANKRLINKTYV